MKPPTLPHLLLAGLLALLVFGSCGGGVHYFLYGLGRERRVQLQQAMQQEQREHRTARHLRGAANRRAAHLRAEADYRARLDSLGLGEQGERKMHHRYHKVQRQLRQFNQDNGFGSRVNQ